MKKRLLITSIVMMLVVAVALSTATYAWFTSNDAVTANTLTMYAAINQDSALEISYTNTEDPSNWLTTIAATSPANSTKFEPAAAIIAAAPASLQKHASNTTGTYFAAMDWQSAKIINSKFKTAPATSQRYIWTDTTHESFFLHNGSTANTITNINVTAAITGAAQSFIRIAIFKNDGSGNFELYGILSNGELFQKATAYAAATNYYASTAEDAEPVSGITDAASFAAAVEASADKMLYTKNASYNSAAVATSAFDTSTVYTSIITDQAICTQTIALGGLGVNDKVAGGADEMELKVAVWMDGSALNDDTASTSNKTATIELTFSVGAAA